MGNDLGFRLAQHQLRGFDDVVQNGQLATSLRPPTNLVSTRTRFVTACAE